MSKKSKKFLLNYAKYFMFVFVGLVIAMTVIAIFYALGYAFYEWDWNQFHLVMENEILLGKEIRGGIIICFFAAVFVGAFWALIDETD